MSRNCYACCNMYSLGLHIENIGDQPKTSQGLPRLQTALYIIRESYEGTCTSPYNHIMYIQMVYLTPPPPLPIKKYDNDNRQSFCSVH